MRVDFVERVGELDRDVDRGLHVEWTGRQLRRQRLPFHELHGDEARSGVFADFINLRDVRMTDCRRGLRLPNKSPHARLVAREFVGKNFERHSAAELEVFSEVDAPHASCAEQTHDAIVTNRLLFHRS